MKNLVTNINIKLLTKNIIPKNIKKFFLNNIDKLLNKIAGSMRFLIKITANIITSSFNTNSIFLD